MPNPHSTYGDLFTDGIQTRWNASALKNWLKCPRYYYYTNVLQVQGDTVENVHLRFGTHYAEALQHYWLARADGADHTKALRGVIRQALEDTWDTYIDDEGEVHHSEWEPEHRSFKGRFTLIRTLVWYFDEFPEKDDLPLFYLDSGAPAVELKFELPADNGVSFVGTLDRVVYYGSDLMVMDQKTTGGSLGPHYFRQYDLDEQVSLYTMVGQVVFNSEIKGMIIDATEIKAGFSRYARHPVYRSPSQHQEWYDEAMLHIEDAQRAARENRFPRNSESCDKYGGCVFRDICSKPREVRENFLRGKFEGVK